MRAKMVQLSGIFGVIMGIGVVVIALVAISGIIAVMFEFKDHGCMSVVTTIGGAIAAFIVFGLFFSWIMSDNPGLAFGLAIPCAAALIVGYKLLIR